MQTVKYKRGRCSHKKPGSPQVTAVEGGETELMRVGAPGAPGETKMRGDGDASERPGETSEVMRAAGGER